jgi:SAM-dependent methyltransferase
MSRATERVRFLISRKGIRWLVSRRSLVYARGLLLDAKDLVAPPPVVDGERGLFDMYNEIAEKYSESELVYSLSDGKQRESCIRGVLAGFKGRTLDLGCGDSHYAPYIQEYVGADAARASLLRSPDCLSKAQSVAQCLPFASESFDNVMLSEVLEHIPEREAVLREVFRILKSNGKFLVSVPRGHNPDKLYSPHALTSYGIAHRRYLHGEFSEENLSSLLTSAGFREISVSSPFWFQLIGLCVK